MAGLRKAELENLLWTDVDFTAGLIRVTKKDWQPKTWEARDIEVPDELRRSSRNFPGAFPAAGMGIYGVISYFVNLIRMALGAHPKDILRWVALLGFKLVAIGIFVGVGLAAGLP